VKARSNPAEAIRFLYWTLVPVLAKLKWSPLLPVQLAELWRIACSRSADTTAGGLAEWLIQNVLTSKIERSPFQYARTAISKTWARKEPDFRRFEVEIPVQAPAEGLEPAQIANTAIPSPVPIPKIRFEPAPGGFVRPAVASKRSNPRLEQLTRQLEQLERVREQTPKPKAKPDRAELHRLIDQWANDPPDSQSDPPDPGPE